MGTTPQPLRRTTGNSIPKSIRWTLLLFICSIPFEAVDLGMGDLISPARLAALPFFIACLFHAKLSFRRPSAPVWWFSGYLAVVVFKGLATPADLRGRAVGAFLTVVQLVIFFWIASNLFRNQKLASQALLTYAFSIIILAVGTLANVPGFARQIETHETETTRVTALAYSTNDLAAIASLGAVILLGSFLSADMKRSRRFLFGAAALPLLLLVVQTGSRSGVAALLLGLAVFLLPAGGTRRAVVAVMLAAAIVSGVIFLVATNPLMEARIDASYYYGDTAGHTRIYQTALGMISERPLTGWGPEVGLSELGARLSYKRGARDAHNLLLHLLLEVGIIGTVPFLIGLFLVTKAAWQGRKGPLGLAPLALIVVVLTVNAAHTFLGRKPMWLVLAVAIASALHGRVRQHASARRVRTVAPRGAGGFVTIGSSRG